MTIAEDDRSVTSLNFDGGSAYVKAVTNICDLPASLRNSEIDGAQEHFCKLFFVPEYGYPYTMFQNRETPLVFFDFRALLARIFCIGNGSMTTTNRRFG